AALPAPPLSLSRHRSGPSPVLKSIVRLDHQIDALALRFGLFQLGIHLRRNDKINVRIGRAAELDPQLLGRRVIADSANARRFTGCILIMPRPHSSQPDNNNTPPTLTVQMAPSPSAYGDP